MTYRPLIYCSFCEEGKYESEFPLLNVEPEDSSTYVCATCLDNRKAPMLQEIKDIIDPLKVHYHKYYDLVNVIIYRKALKSGRLVPQPCTSCSSIENIHGHHFDYKKPLHVTWLCASCHARLHHCMRKLETYYDPITAFNLWR